MKESKERNFWIWFGIVLAVAILLRVVLFMTYPEVSYSDTASYRRSANAILDGLKAYDGTRTPGYPAFMALLGPDRVVYFVQLLLGLGMTMAWFWIGWKATGKPFFGGLAGLAHTLNPGQIFFEANLLTETLSTFWLILAFLGVFIWLEFPKTRSIGLGLGVGLGAALAALTRPLFIFVPVWLAVFLAFSLEHKKLRFNWKGLFGVLLPAVLLVGGWMLWIQKNYHIFSLTTMTGYHLVQHTGYYFDDVPDEDAVLRDVYLDFREQRLKTYGTQGNTIWDAIPALQEASGMNFYELSRELQRISVQLILTHPWHYVGRVLRGWWLFWRAPVYWSSRSISSGQLVLIFRTMILSVRGLIFGANIVFIITTLTACVSKRLREIWALRPFLWLLAGSVWASSVASSMLDHGDNPRFLIPLQTAVLFWVLWVIVHSWQALRSAPKGLEH